MDNSDQQDNDDQNGGLRQRSKEAPDDGPSPDQFSIETDENLHMGRNVGLISGISLIVGSIIGSGIFISPKGVLSDTGSVGLSLVVWALSGVIALLGALSYAELGTLIRLSGGEYAYIRAALGNICAYLYAWTSIIVIRPSTLAIICLVFAEYVASFFRMCGSPVIPNKLVAAIALITVGIVNCWSTKLAARVQVVFTVAKLIALFIIIIGGIVKLAQGNTAVLATGFTGSTTSPSVIALAFYGALWAYDGWNNLNFVTEEIKEPKKNLPRANIIGVVLVTIVYVLTNISYLAVLSTQQLLDSAAVAVTWGDLILGAAAIIMPLSVMISTFGAANGTAFSGSRVVYAAARDHNLPDVLSYIQVKQLTPMPSMLFTIFISLLMIIPGDIGSLIDFFSFTAWAFYGMTFLSLIVLRFRMKDAPRPYKVPIPIPVIMFLVSIYLVIAPIVDNPQMGFLYAFLFVIGGLILYFPFVHFKLKLCGWDRITMYCQLVFNIVPSSVEPDE
ncbi:b(0,+)-type amino acid transporter 1-like [Haliotis rubra]|uniref:b(0,+)-type amino acid transporter 1-like n=1 Tax=Haliotis rubra TaxID=36100 RepID=UPI001EE5BAE9|nr:b(0,+)-type amino acid transporter 1-like [Haliotis rubra]